MADGDDPLTEILATGALVLVMGAIIGGVIGAVELGRGSTATAIIAWAAAAVGFGISLVYFMADARQGERAAAELPFPSWLRTESESVR
jgi:membrane associated rhomboid family serine protease